MTLEESGSEQLNHLMRCGQYSASADDYVVPAATKFLCISKFRGKYVKFVVAKHALCYNSTCES